MGEIIRETYSAEALCQPQVLQVPVKEDVIVPDTREDVGRILQCSAVYMPGDCVRERKRLRFEGSLEFTVLYREEGERERIHSLKTAVPVEESLNLEGLAEDEDKLRYELNYEVENIRATLLNSRKISLGALLEAQVQLSRQTELSVITGAEDEEELQFKRIREPGRRLVGDLKEKFIVRETIPVKDGDPNISEMLWWDCRIKDRRVRILSDRVEIKGEAGICILYRNTAEDGIQFREVSVPFTGSADCPGAVGEDQQACVRLGIVHSYIRTAQDDDGEERLFETELVLEASIRVYEEEERTLICDAYHIRQEAELTRAQCPLQHFVFCGENDLEVTRPLELPENGPELLQIFYTAGRSRIDDCTVTENQVLIEGVLYVTVFYLTSPGRGPLASFEEAVPFSRTLMIPGAREGQMIQAESRVEAITAVAAGDRRAELRAQLVLEICLTEEKKVPVLTELMLREPDRETEIRRPSAALCFVDGEESLWDIAKRLRVRQDSLERINDFTVLALR